MTEQLKPIPDLELAKLEALDAIREQTLRVSISNNDPAQVQTVKAVCMLADAVPSLIAEIRRMRDEGLQGHAIGPGGDRWQCEIEIENLKAQVFASKVEIENLRKQLADARAVSSSTTLQNLCKETFEFPPRPMCRPDPLGDWPAVENEGSPT